MLSWVSLELLVPLPLIYASTRNRYSCIDFLTLVLFSWGLVPWLATYLLRLSQCKKYVYKNRIRLNEFFRDYDKV